MLPGLQIGRLETSLRICEWLNKGGTFIFFNTFIHRVKIRKLLTEIVLRIRHLRFVIRRDTKLSITFRA
jgi:hypothetical protein